MTLLSVATQIWFFITLHDISLFLVDLLWGGGLNYGYSIFHLGKTSKKKNSKKSDIVTKGR